MAIPILIASLTRASGPRLLFRGLGGLGTLSVSLMATLLYRGSRQDVYNILWAVVFGFATLNILSLAARRMEPGRRRLSFGELMAVSVVLLSIFLLGWEMLSTFHIFPIKLQH